MSLNFNYDGSDFLKFATDLKYYITSTQPEKGYTIESLKKTVTRFIESQKLFSTELYAHTNDQDPNFTITDIPISGNFLLQTSCIRLLDDETLVGPMKITYGTSPTIKKNN